MEIKKSFNRFISILLIVMLGVAFFSGTRATEWDMRYTADTYYDQRQLMDIRVLGTLGLTSEDVESIRQIDGVSDAVGGYFADIISNLEGSQHVFRVMADMGEKNRVDVLEGRMPQKAGECLVDVGSSMASTPYKIGDVFVLESDNGSELSDTLSTNTFEVVGIGSSPEYVSFTRGSTTVGDGGIDAFVIVTADSFSLDVFTKIDVWVEDSETEIAYTQGYNDKIDAVLKRIEQTLADVRCEARYLDITGEAQEEIDKAGRELTEAQAGVEAELKDAQAQLESAEAEIKTGQATIDEKKEEIASAKSQLYSGQQTLASGQLQLAGSEAELASGWAQYEDGLAQYEQGAALLASSRSQLDDGWSQYNAGVAQYEAAVAEVSAAQAQMSSWSEALTMYEQLQQAQPLAVAALEALDAAWPGTKQVLQGAIDAIDMQLALLPPDGSDTVREYLESQRASAVSALEYAQAEYETSRTELQSYKDQIDSGIAQIEANLSEEQRNWSAYDAAEAELAAAQEELAIAKTQLEATKAQLDAAEAEYAAGAATLHDSKQILDDSLAQLNDGQAQLDAAKAEIASGQAALNLAQQQIASGEAQISSAESELANAQIQLEDGWEEYSQGKAEAQKEFDNAQREINDAQAQVDAIDYPIWYVSDRSALADHAGFGDNAERIGAIAKWFPMLFFIVAAMISLTTMTRMVEEQRTQIGTMKALGYSKITIAGKYIAYAFLATIIGSVIGILIGQKAIPYVLVTAYKLVYPHVDNVTIPYDWSISIMASLIAIGCVTLATIFACYKELAAVPAALMRPVPPKQGKRIFLERIPFLWKLLSFSQKSTLRNLFRYKKRLFMTLFGISGCMALVIVGFGIKDSIGNVVSLQYDKVQPYSSIVILDEDAADSEWQQIYEYLNNENAISHYKDAYMSNYDVEVSDRTLSTYMLVPKDKEQLDAFLYFNDRESGMAYELDNQGAIITEKMSQLMNLKVGDTFFVKIDEFSKREVKVSHICENYVGHYIYMMPEYYEDVFDEPVSYNALLLRFTSENENVQTIAGENLLKSDAVLNVSFSTDMRQSLEDILDALNIIVIVLIIAAGLLAFVVLYNLNNININERRRELATLKVLGFHDIEVANYVYRENIYLTALSMVIGVVLGKYLHRFIMLTVEVDECMFSRQINLSSYIYGALLTIVFSLIVNFVMFYRLRKIDMVESLKSVE